MSIVIVQACRTPMGKFQGQWSKTPATDLASYLIRSLIPHYPCLQDPTGSLIWGCALNAGLGQAPARQLVQKSALSHSTPAYTINEVCGSSLRAVIHGYQTLQSENAPSWVLTGGMENMSLAPYMAPRRTTKMGHQSLDDSMIKDGLENFSDQKLMGQLADMTAQTYPLSRQDHDSYVLNSWERALQAPRYREIVPYTMASGQTLQDDEPLYTVKKDKVPTLPPIFHKTGVLTAAHCSALADGASCLLLMDERQALDHGYQPLAKIIGWAEHYHQPQDFSVAPQKAIQKLCYNLGWPIHKVDAWEINEAFSLVPLSCIYDLDIPAQRVNMWGGACNIGHPLGTSGSRIVGTLAHILKDHHLQRGIASLCIGGGGALSIAIENMEKSL